MPGPAGLNRRVVLFGNPVLRSRAKRVTEVTPELRRLFADLKQTMLEQDGLGLAATQVGEPVAVFAVNPRAVEVDRDACCIVNPEVVEREGLAEAEEGCLSFPGLYEVLARPERVKVRGLDEQGAPFELEASGTLARALLHETDHLQGVLFIDHLSPARLKMLEARLKDYEERERTASG
jgi:peptide deformylase